MQHFKCLLLIVWLWGGMLSAQKKYSSLQEAFSVSGRLSGDFGPRSINWINGGEKFSYLEGQNIKVFSPKEGKEEVVFEASALNFPNTSQKFTYNSFQWSKDSKYIVFQTNFRPVYRRSGLSDYYVYSIEDKSLKELVKDAQTAELSFDGTKVAYEKGGNLFFTELSTQKETQLTSDAQPNFVNGRFGWVYEEEFGKAQAWMWSPDSKYIAFWQTDEREVPLYQMTDYSGLDDAYERLPYPRVGDKNPLVRIGVIDINTNAKQWMKIDLNDGYIPRLYWTSVPGQLAVVHLNRKQNHLQLFFCQAQSGSAQKIMEEKSAEWIDIFDFFAGIEDYFFFPENIKEFFWVSERDGFAHIYRYNYEGKLLNQVTKGDWEVVFVHGIDLKSKKVYYTSTEKSPLERHLYEINWDGKNKKRLTQEPGRHIVNFSPNGQYYIDRYSNVTTPTQVELWETGKKMLKKFTDNEKVSQFIKEYNYAPRELMQFTNSNGDKIDLYIVKPIGFQENKKYPLVLNIYGGPGAQSVYNEFGRDIWEQYLAQEGYVVVNVNNRGSGGYGKKFEKTVYGRLGQFESQDFVEAAKYMATMPWVDGEKMAIRGHSYGGFMSSYTMLKHPGVFKVAIVGAPVIDWRLYDSAYAERYMGLLPENNMNYEASSSATYARNLQGKMFVAHSAMDENVHVKHTFQLMKALIDNGKDADLRIYPPGAHGVAYNQTSRLLLYTQYTDYLNQHLKN